MHITQLGANQTEIRIGRKHVLFSYSTPVAYFDEETGKRFITNKKYSRTTSKHISTWLAGGAAETVDQTVLDNLTQEN